MPSWGPTTSSSPYPLAPALPSHATWHQTQSGGLPGDGTRPVGAVRLSAGLPGAGVGAGASHDGAPGEPQSRRGAWQEALGLAPRPSQRHHHRRRSRRKLEGWSHPCLQHLCLKTGRQTTRTPKSTQYLAAQAFPELTVFLILQRYPQEISSLQPPRSPNHSL